VIHDRDSDRDSDDGEILSPNKGKDLDAAEEGDFGGQHYGHQQQGSGQSSGEEGHSNTIHRRHPTTSMEHQHENESSYDKRRYPQAEMA